MIRRWVLVLAVGAAACLGPRPDPSTFYVLSAAATPAETVRPLNAKVGLGPVSLPDYLDRSELVTRLSDNQLAVSATERWAEPFEASLLRALGSNLDRLLRPEGRVDYPWYRSYSRSNASKRLSANLSTNNFPSR